MKKILTGILALSLFVIGSAHIYGQANISVPQAREVALAMTGGGTINSLQLTSGPGGPVYQVVVLNNAVRYEILINAQTGEVIGLNSGQAAGLPAVTMAPPPGGGVGNVMPMSPQPRQGGGGRHANAQVSRERAIEIAYAHLRSRGFHSAAFRTDSGIDWERGRWVWELEFRDVGTVIEFYIDINTGDIVKFEVERSGRGRGW